MKITPVSSGAPTPAPVDVRTVKMTVNATPLTSESLPQAQQTAPQLSIPDANETKAVPEATEPLSPQFAELAKRRRALQVKERELSDREKAFSSQSQGSDKIDLAQLKSEPLKVLLDAGVTYDQLTEAILADRSGNETRALKTEIESLKQEIDKKFVDKETQAEQQVLAEMRREAKKLTAEGETFELVRATRSVPDVMELIERTYRTTGEVLEVTEACQLVEDALLDRYSQLANLKKIQSRFAPPVQQLPQRQGMRTLTNKDTASIPLTAKQRALAAFHGTLKK